MTPLTNQPDPEPIARLRTQLARYGLVTGGGPVYRVLTGAVRSRAWGVGSAQCRSILEDAFSLRMMETDEEEELVRALAAHFEALRLETSQPLARWSCASGRWEDPPASLWDWILVGRRRWWSEYDGWSSR